MPKKATPKEQKIEVTQQDDDVISQLAQWIEQDGFEGELSVDVFQDDKNLYVKAPVAGVDTDKLEISINNDMLTIRGYRTQEHDVSNSDYFFQECYWGGFSRSVIVPVDVKSDDITAELKNGILTVTLPKLQRSRNIPIDIKE